MSDKMIVDKDKFDALLRRAVSHKPMPRTEVKIKRKPKLKRVIEPQR